MVELIAIPAISRHSSGGPKKIWVMIRRDWMRLKTLHAGMHKNPTSERIVRVALPYTEYER